MSSDINRLRYSVHSSTLLAHNCYYDEHNVFKSGRNTWLYRTTGGEYFAVYLPLWTGEEYTIEPLLNLEEVIRIYENLVVHVEELMERVVMNNEMRLGPVDLGLGFHVYVIKRGIEWYFELSYKGMIIWADNGPYTSVKTAIDAAREKSKVLLPDAIFNPHKYP